jgi:hypothetical protein
VLLAHGPEDLPAAPYTLGADRKRALPPRVIGVEHPVAPAPDQLGEPTAIRGWPLVHPASRHSAGEREVPGVLQPLWLWQARSLNVHPLDDWQRAPGARGERLRLRATFGADFLPPDLCLVFEEGIVEEVALNGAALNLAVGRAPHPTEIEMADICARLLPLAHHPAIAIGENVLEVTVLIPASERIAFPTLVASAQGEATAAESLGPCFVAGSFALRRDLRECSLVRPPLEVTVGPWTQAGYPRFAGTATYRQTVALASAPSSARHIVVDALDGRVSATVNETPLGGPVRSPCVFDATAALRAGINHLAIDVISDLSPRVHGSPAGLAAVHLERGAAV